MNHPGKKSTKVRKARPSLFVERLKAALLAIEEARRKAEAFVPEPLDRSVMSPAPPAMLTPEFALLRLRAVTGCSIARRTLYLWLKNERIYAVRLGRRIYIPVEALDDFIKDWLTQEPLGRVM